MTFYAPHGKAYVTTRALRWKSPDVVVPEGFHFNVSVPGWLTWLVNPHDERLLKAAAFHDYALRDLRWSRPTAAGLWNDVLRDDAGISSWWRAVLFVALGTWKWR